MINKNKIVREIHRFKKQNSLSKIPLKKVKVLV